MLVISLYLLVIFKFLLRSPEYTQKMLVSLVYHSSLNTWSYPVPTLPGYHHHLGPSDIIINIKYHSISFNIINPPHSCHWCLLLTYWSYGWLIDSWYMSYSLILCWPIDPIDVSIRTSPRSWSEAVDWAAWAMWSTFTTVSLWNDGEIWWRFITDLFLGDVFGCVWCCSLEHVVGNESWRHWKQRLKQLQEACASRVSNPDLLEQ